jgi:hypothetical protein
MKNDLIDGARPESAHGPPSDTNDLARRVGLTRQYIARRDEKFPRSARAAAGDARIVAVLAA